MIFNCGFCPFLNDFEKTLFGRIRELKRQLYCFSHPKKYRKHKEIFAQHFLHFVWCKVVYIRQAMALKATSQSLDSDQLSLRDNICSIFGTRLTLSNSHNQIGNAMSSKDVSKVINYKWRRSAILADSRLPKAGSSWTTANTSTFRTEKWSKIM